MKRLQLIEIEDQPWCPRAIRDAATDYLCFLSSRTSQYEPIVPILAAALRRTGARHVLDLCSGGAGPWPWLGPALADMGLDISVRLSDKYPNLGANGALSGPTNQSIRYHAQPVDARHVSEELAGFRTMFSAFHHFAPADAREVLADAVRRREGIAIFEALDRSTRGLLLMALVPAMVLVTTAFIRPFCWSRLLWTYLVPLTPLITFLDGVVSCLRTYKPAELRELAAGTGVADYAWEIGSLKNPRAPIPVTYLIGIPVTSCPN